MFNSALSVSELWLSILILHVVRIVSNSHNTTVPMINPDAHGCYPITTSHISGIVEGRAPFRRLLPQPVLHHITEADGCHAHTAAACRPGQVHLVVVVVEEGRGVGVVHVSTRQVAVLGVV